MLHESIYTIQDRFMGAGGYKESYAKTICHLLSHISEMLHKSIYSKRQDTGLKEVSNPNKSGNKKCVETGWFFAVLIVSPHSLLNETFLGFVTAVMIYRPL